MGVQLQYDPYTGQLKQNNQVLGWDSQPVTKTNLGTYSIGSNPNAGLLDQFKGWIGLGDPNKLNRWNLDFNDAINANLMKHTTYGDFTSSQQQAFRNFIGSKWDDNFLNTANTTQLQDAVNAFKATKEFQNADAFEWFGKGKDQYGNPTRGGATAFQWLGAGLGTAQALYGMYQGNKQMKLARENFEEQKALSRANYAMQAKSYNNSLANQQSGRTFTGMSGSARRALAEDYQRKKAIESYR